MNKIGTILAEVTTKHFLKRKTEVVAEKIMTMEIFPPTNLNKTYTKKIVFLNQEIIFCEQIANIEIIFRNYVVTSGNQ